MSIFSGIPGTDTKVTPEIEAPIMPKATMNQGDWLLALKNVELEFPARPVTLDVMKSSEK